ncbi:MULTISPECIES: hypothetical protein [Streptomyces]|uniref:Uncharacterized protein n=1 Tax=Streptomyces amritsarensis TaxID=681158 RepID=A0ABX3G1U4_9ACTN|nr:MULTISPECIES: hypothetical protein [Streptomyces]OLZ63418.1 hypothetical protein AVW11_20540 [Streptomyces amritsarensis]
MRKCEGSTPFCRPWRRWRRWPPDPTVVSVIEATNPSGERIANLREDGIRFQGFTVQTNLGSALGGYGINTVVGHSGRRRR